MIYFLEISLLTWSLLAFFVVVLPIISRIDCRKLEVALAEGDQRARVRFYDQATRFQWVTSILFVVAWAIFGEEWRQLGLVFQPDTWQWVAIAVSLAACVGVYLTLRAFTSNPRALAKISRELGRRRCISSSQRG